MVLMMVLMTLGAMAVVRERVSGTMGQLIVTPLDPRALMIGKLAPYAGVGLIALGVGMGMNQRDLSALGVGMLSGYLHQQGRAMAAKQTTP